jgi:hypothetical protein
MCCTRLSCRYQLTQTVRVHTGADDDAYSCMGWGPDREGINGVWLRKDVPLQVSQCLCKQNKRRRNNSTKASPYATSSSLPVSTTH